MAYILIPFNSHLYHRPMFLSVSRRRNVEAVLLTPVNFLFRQSLINVLFCQSDPICFIAPEISKHFSPVRILSLVFQNKSVFLFISHPKGNTEQEGRYMKYNLDLRVLTISVVFSCPETFLWYTPSVKSIGEWGKYLKKIEESPMN